MGKKKAEQKILDPKEARQNRGFGLEVLDLRLLEIWRKKIQNSEEGEEESNLLLLVVVVTKQ